MAGGGEHVQLCLAATGVGVSLDGLHEVVIHLHGNGVGIVIIVAKERSAVHDELSHLLQLRVDS